MTATAAAIDGDDVALVVAEKSEVLYITWWDHYDEA